MTQDSSDREPAKQASLEGAPKIRDYSNKSPQ